MFTERIEDRVIYKFTTANRSTRSSLNKGKEKAEKHLSEKRWDMYPFQQHHTSVRLFISYIYAGKNTEMQLLVDTKHFVR